MNHLNNNFNLTSKQIGFSKKKIQDNIMSNTTSPYFPIQKSSKVINIKALKVTDMYKNLYQKETGYFINSIIDQNGLLKYSDGKLKKSKKQSYENDKLKNIKEDIIKNEVFNPLKSSPLHRMTKIASESNLNTKYKTVNKFEFNHDKSRESNLFITVKDKDSFQNTKMHSAVGDKFYCPFCSHCNTIKDENLEYYIYVIRDSKNIINKGFDYIIHSDILSNLDIFKESKKNPDTGFIDTSKFETLLTGYPKNISKNRLSYQILAHFLNALLHDKIGLDVVIDTEILLKFKESLLSKGQAFNELEEKVELDKELESLFDENTKRIVNDIIHSKVIKEKVFIETTHENNIYATQKIIKNSKKIDDTKTKKIKNSSSKSASEENYNFNKKFSVLFLIFIQLLSEIAQECKERAVLLYKFFKLYFVEQEKKWALIYDKMNRKIKYYQELCKTIIHQKNQNSDKIESINDILFSNIVSYENLHLHKKLINDLLSIINEKREEIYLQNTNIEILEKEIRLWIYDFDSIKLSQEIRVIFIFKKNKLSLLNTDLIVQNITGEMSHKGISKEEKSLLINADRFTMISSQRGYFYEQKIFFAQEQERLKTLHQKNYYKKREWKQKYLLLTTEIQQMKLKLEKEISFYKDKLMTERVSVGSNTDVDILEFNKIMKNHYTVKNSKSLTHNKLANFIERIKYGCSKNLPISKKSLLYLISEIYNEKIETDNKIELNVKRRIGFEDFLYSFMADKFKLTKIVKKHCEETMLGILKFSNEDPRIDLIRRFLGLGEDKLRCEILDQYLILLKTLPFSFLKLFDDEFFSYTIKTEYCFDIYKTKFRYYNLLTENRDNVIKLSTVLLDDIEIKLGHQKKYDYFLLTRFYKISEHFINELATKFQSGDITEVPVDTLYDEFSLVNRDFQISLTEFYMIILRVFMCNSTNLNLEIFLSFFNKKYNFIIKISDFLDLSLLSLISIYHNLEKKIIESFENIEFNRQGLIFFKEFHGIFMKLLLFDENKWKIAEYFKYNCN